MGGGPQYLRKLGRGRKRKTRSTKEQRKRRSSESRRKEKVKLRSASLVGEFVLSGKRSGKVIVWEKSRG